MKNKLKNLVIGIGGCGNNIVNFIASKANSSLVTLSVQKDLQALHISDADFKLNTLDRAFEDRLNILASKADKIFIIAGLGGSTGSYYCKYIAKLLFERNIQFNILVNIPFLFEGNRRKELANETLEDLNRYTSNIFIINDQKIEMEDFKKLDNYLYQEIVRLVQKEDSKFDSLEKVFQYIADNKYCIGRDGIGACGTCGCGDAILMF